MQKVILFNSFKITLTLWGAEAEKFDGSSNPVVAVKVCSLTL